MAADRILRIGADGNTEGVIIPVVSSGAVDAGKAVGLDANGKLDMSVMPTGIGLDSVALVATEALSAGDFVNIYDNAGTVSVRKADNSEITKKADGFVLASVANGGSAVVYIEGDNTALTGLVVGTNYMLGAAGAVTTTAPSTSGTVIQSLGMVKNATTIRFEQRQPILNA